MNTHPMVIMMGTGIVIGGICFIMGLSMGLSIRVRNGKRKKAIYYENAKSKINVLFLNGFILDPTEDYALLKCSIHFTHPLCKGDRIQIQSGETIARI